MTREDIDRIASEYFDDKKSEHEMDEVFDLAKKALEERREDILDKIRPSETGGEVMSFPNTFDEYAEQYQIIDTEEVYTNKVALIPVFRVEQWLEHEMSAEQYRQRMIQAFHNADCDELIAVAVLPTEKEFEHLEWLLKREWHKREPVEWCDIPADDMNLEQARAAVKELRYSYARFREQMKKSEILSYIDRIDNAGMGKKKALEYLRKYLKGDPCDELE